MEYNPFITITCIKCGHTDWHTKEIKYYKCIIESYQKEECIKNLNNVIDKKIKRCTKYYNEKIVKTKIEETKYV